MTKVYSPEDAERLRVIHMYLSGAYTRKIAAMNLGITERQITRIIQKYIESGPESVIHGNTGKEAYNRYPDELRSKIISLYTGKYSKNGAKFNFCHFKEKLEKEEKIIIPYASLRRILLDGGIKPPRAKPTKTTGLPRPRRLFAGELLQVDGSSHRWLYKDPHLYTLHGGIDDAKSIVTGLWLEKEETMHGYQMVLKQTIEQYGIPKCLYTDNRSIFNETTKSKSKTKTKSKLNSPRFRAMLTRLGIDVISTSNSQAKGRVERLWRTLQDRLLNELRLNEITTLDEANAFIKEYLPTFNKRFASAIEPDRNSFRKVPANYDYNQNLALSKEIKVRKGCYIALSNHYFLVRRSDNANNNRQVMLPETVQLYQFLDGSLHVFCDGEWYYLEDIGPRSLHQELISEEKRRNPKNSPWSQFNPNFLNRDRAKWNDENLYKRY